MMWFLPSAFALAVALLPQSFVPWAVLAFRRDWGLRKRWAAAALAAGILTFGAVLLAMIWQIGVGPITPVTAAIWVLLLNLWRMGMAPRREELWRQGRHTRAPILLAVLLTGPSEIGAWVLSKAHAPMQLGLWFLVLWVALGVQISIGQERLEENPGLLADWLPRTGLRAGLSWEALASVLAAAGAWGGLSFWGRLLG